MLREIGETEFIRRHQCGLRTIAAFEKSEYPDDWRELMRLYMVRRTRSFIKDNYAKLDEATESARILTFEDGTRFMFPGTRAQDASSSRSTTKIPTTSMPGSTQPVSSIDINRL